MSAMYYVEFRYGKTPWMRDNLVRGVSQAEATNRALALKDVHDGVRIRHRGATVSMWKNKKRVTWKLRTTLKAHQERVMR